MFELFKTVNQSAEKKEKADRRKKEIERRKKRKKEQDIKDYRLFALMLVIGMLSYLTLALINWIFGFQWS